jgi:hypothetical protein
VPAFPIVEGVEEPMLQLWVFPIRGGVEEPRVVTPAHRGVVERHERSVEWWQSGWFTPASRGVKFVGCLVSGDWLDVVGG